MYMASVYKCDRCGKYYDKSTSSVGPVFKKHKDSSKSDLCKDCKTSLTKWFNDCEREHPEHVEGFVKSHSFTITHNNPGDVKYITVMHFTDALKEYFDYKCNDDNFRLPEELEYPHGTRLEIENVCKTVEEFVFSVMHVEDLYGPILTKRDYVISLEHAKKALKRYFNYEWKDEFYE